MTARVGAWVAGIVCTVVIFVAWTAFEVGGTLVTRAFDDLVLLGASVAASVSCLLRSARAAGRERRAWHLLGLSCLSWAAGQSVWVWDQNVLGKTTPFPSLADIGFVIAMPLAGWAVLCFGWVPTRVSRMRSLLDGILIAGSTACLAWFFLLREVWLANYDGQLETVLSTAYPVGTAIAACLVVAVLGRCPRHRSSLVLVGAGILVLSVTDTGYAYLLAQGRYATGDPIDVGWLVGFCLLGLAARVPSAPVGAWDEESPQPLWSLLVPYAPMSLLAVVAAVTLASGRHLDAFMGSGVIALAVVLFGRHCLTIVEHKRAESHLQSTARQLREAQELTHIGSWEWELSTGKVLFSDELYRIHRIEVGSPILNEAYGRELVHPDDKALFDSACEVIASGSGTTDIQYRIVRTDGKTRWLHGRSSPRSEGASDVRRVHGTLEDITDRKATEEALCFQAGLLEAVGEAVIATDTDGNITYWNRAAEQLYGWASEEVLASSIADVLPVDVPEEGAEVLTHLRSGRKWSGDVWLRRRDGSRFPAYLSGTPVLDGAGKLVGIIGISSDASERRAAEDRVRANEERYRRLVEASPLAIVELDCEGKVQLCNRAAEVTFGQLEDCVDGSGAVELNRDTALGEVLMRVMAGERVMGHEVSASAGDGTAYLEIAADALRGPSGMVTGAIIIGDDITQRKSLEGQLLQAQKLEAVGRLAGGIAHDFNNLLTIVLGHTELLLDSAGENAGAHSGLEAIRAAAERGAALTQRLLTFSRKRLPARTVVDINRSVLSLRDLLARTLGEDVLTETRMSHDTGCVTMEPSELDQVILNLAVNARDAMPEGGDLVISTSRLVVEDSEDGPWAGIPSGEFAVVTVADTGSGMGVETINNCFEPFFTTKPHGKGTGLGLATVYGIISTAGGHIRVESQPGRGTAFTVLFPAVQPTLVVEALSPNWTGTEDTSQRTVLLVEDEEDVRFLAVSILVGEGYEVISASNGLEALALLADGSRDVDVLVTDVVMPEMGGIDLAREMVRMIPQLDVVFVSGYTDRLLPELFSGEKPWLVEKPFRPDALVNTVREVLRARADRMREAGREEGVLCLPFATERNLSMRRGVYAG